MEKLKYLILLVFLALLNCNSASNFNKEVKTIDKINGFKKIRISK